VKKYKTVKLLFLLCLVFQILTLFCYGNSNRFSGGFFDGYDESLLVQSGDGGSDVNSNHRFGGGSFDGYDDAIFVQSGKTNNIANANQRFGGGAFDGYDEAIFFQSDNTNYNANSNQRFGGGAFDGYSDALYIQSGAGAGDLNSKQRFSGGSYDGYDNCDFDYPTPFVEITNAPDFLIFSQTTAQISGTNNSNVSGQLGWLNNRFTGMTNWFDKGFSVEVTGLAEGSNIISIIGANYLSNYVSDSVVIYRETFEDVHPFIDITNENTTVGYDVVTYTIGGTNNANVAGVMNWTNSLTGESGNIQISNFDFQISNFNLEHGDNLITVFGTNIYGHFTNDFVTIHRETFAEVHPFIDITNENATVTYSITLCTIGGTNNANVVGGMNWTNSLTGGSGSIPVSGVGFQVSGILLDVGENLITVSGTNVYGQSTPEPPDGSNNVVSIRRKTLIESEPHIATNALIFPSAYSELYEGDKTNIIWNFEKITDDIDGTNLTITKITVHLVETTNQVGILTNDISNLLGEIPWTVPNLDSKLVSAKIPLGVQAGYSNYVLKFEVVDSSSLTNSRIFWDNEFTIVPESGIILLTLLASFIVISALRRVNWLRPH